LGQRADLEGGIDERWPTFQATQAAVSGFGTATRPRMVRGSLTEVLPDSHIGSPIRFLSLSECQRSQP
jgi:hypothetical protein